MNIVTDIRWIGARHTWMLFPACILATFGVVAEAASLEVTVGDQAGAPAPGAVVELQPVSAGDTASVAAADAQMTQKNQAFAPHVLVVRKGASVAFPNLDPFHHHIYSFSAARTFEIELYSRAEVPSMVFPNAGVVPLGCNIHDNMRGYIYVSEAPYFAATADNGAAAFESIPTGEWRVQVWHPRAAQGVSTSVMVGEGADGRQSIAVQIDLEPRRLDELDELEAGGYD
jgi:plastocyanin